MHRVHVPMLCATHVCICLLKLKKMWVSSPRCLTSRWLQCPQANYIDEAVWLSVRNQFTKEIWIWELFEQSSFAYYILYCRFTAPLSEILGTENQINGGIQVPQISNRQVGIEYLNLNDWKILVIAHCCYILEHVEQFQVLLALFLCGNSCTFIFWLSLLPGPKKPYFANHFLSPVFFNFFSPCN